MPASRKQTKSAKPKTLKVFEQIRNGTVYWLSETKIPKIAAEGLGFSKNAEGLFETERPLSSELRDFTARAIKFGFIIKKLDVQEPIKPSVSSAAALTEGEQRLKELLVAKEAVEKAKEEEEEAKNNIREWLQRNGAPKDPAHDEARVAQIGAHRVHNSWVRGRETKFDDRDHTLIADWAIREDCANELVNVVVHKTISYEEFLASGGDASLPDGFEMGYYVDSDMYDYFVGVGMVPNSLHSKFENRGSGYYALKLYESKDLSCPNCGHKVGKTQKFCGECGCKQ